MNIKSGASKKILGIIGGSVLISVIAGGCAGGSLTTREKGAGIGALSGAAVGGLIGSAVRHPALGAAIGGGLGLGAGALIGDQLQGRENQAWEQEQQIYRNQQDLSRQRQELENLGRRTPEY
ncbi:MAG TPA: glycine zipper domain-containing protein [Candidatus Binatia bacterium]|nr:glycine zipper domain-containing protein [Candidatus Binatia bacterium]